MTNVLKKLEEVRRDIASRLSDIWTQNSLLESRMVSIQRYLGEEVDRAKDTRLREVAAELGLQSAKGTGYDDQEKFVRERMETVYDFLTGPTDAVLANKTELDDLRAMAAKFEELNGVKPDTVGYSPGDLHEGKDGGMLYPVVIEDDPEDEARC